MEELHSTAPPPKRTRKVWPLYVVAFTGWIAYFGMIAATTLDRRDRNRRLDSMQKELDFMQNSMLKEIDSLKKQADSLRAERQRRTAKDGEKR